MNEYMLKLARHTPATKVASDGHWRKLPVTHTGTDQAGNEVSGKTWVSRSRMKASIQPYAHQRSFVESTRGQIGAKGGGILAAHGTGTGKTLSGIAAFEDLKERGYGRRALVVAPAGLRDNFLEKGINVFTDSKGVLMSRPGAADDDVEYVVTSYDAFRRDPQGWVDKVRPDTIIADEVHRASDPSSKTYKALMQARQDVPNFIGLTASVVQNNPDELIPLMALASNQKSAITSKEQFNRNHIKKMPSETRGIFGGKTYEKKLVAQAKLNAALGKTVHYIEDLDASAKPAKDVVTVNVDMSAEQLALYRMSMKGIDPVLLKKIREGEEVAQKDALAIFTRLMRARQVSNSMHLAVPHMTAAQAALATPKVRQALSDVEKHLTGTEDGQVVLYTNFVHGGVDVLMAGLEERGIPYGVFAGKGVDGITEDTRQQAVRDYLAGKIRAIIITGAGAEGLSLGNTTMVALLDGHYNPERISQAEARGIRAGGLSHRAPDKRRVEVRRYVSAVPKNFWQKMGVSKPEKSVEQFVYSTADRKDKLNKQLRVVLRDRTDRNDKDRNSIFGRLRGA